jgi:predicted GIY-YIG superfamily endonuclease
VTRYRLTSKRPFTTDKRAILAFYRWKASFQQDLAAGQENTLYNRTMQAWHVYILRCADGSLYTGITTDLAKRVAVHQSGKGAKYTRGRLPVEIVYHEAQRSKGTALRREAEIKRWRKDRKEDLLAR